MSNPVIPSTALADTNYLYSSIPQYIQDWDASNNYELLTWLDGVCSMVQPVDDFSRDSLLGVGWNLLFNYNYYNSFVTAQPIISVSTNQTGSKTFTTYTSSSNSVLAGQYVTTSNFAITTNNVVNQLVVSADSQSFTVATTTQTGTDTTGNVSNVTPKNIYNALIVLPWMAQFFGTQLDQIPNLVFTGSSNATSFCNAVIPYINNWIFVIKNSNNFQRGTVNWFLITLSAYLTKLYNQNNPNSPIALIPVSAFTLLEQTKFIQNNYVYDPYNVIVFFPAQYVLNSTYQSAYITPFATYSAATYTNYNSIPNAFASVQSQISVNLPGGRTLQAITT
jgi:hypothetical protein